MFPNTFFPVDGFVTVPIPQGQNWVLVGGLNMTFTPTSAFCSTAGNAVIGASPDQSTFSNQGCVVNLSGAPLDGSQTLSIQFGAYIPPGGAAYVSGDLQSKITRAVRAWLITQGVVTIDNCYAAPASDDRKLPNTTIEVTGDGEQDAGFGPGNYKFRGIEINLRDDAVIQPDEAATDPRVAANTRMTGIWDNLNVSNDSCTLYYTAQQITAAGRLLAVDQSNGADPVQAAAAAANADMASFSMLWWEAVTMGTMGMASKGTYWERTLIFEAIACNATLAP